MADWAKRLVDASGASNGQAVHDHIATIPQSKVYRAFDILKNEGFPSYTSTSNYKTWARDYVANNASNPVNTSTEIFNYMSTFSEMD
jgi:hypothetical protein